jgi:hypothetical protein
MTMHNPAPLFPEAVDLGKCNVLTFSIPADEDELTARLRELGHEGTAEPKVTFRYVRQPDSGTPPLRIIFVTATVTGACGKGGVPEEVTLFTFVNDHGYASRLRERFGFPAACAVILDDAARGTGPARVEVVTDVYPQLLHVSSQKPQESLTGCVLSFRYELGRQLVHTAMFPSHFLHLFQIRDAVRAERAREQALIKVAVSSDLNVCLEVTVTDVEMPVARNIDLGIDLAVKHEVKHKARASADRRVVKSALSAASDAALNKLVIGTSPLLPPCRAVGRFVKFFEPRADPRSPPPYSFENIFASGFKFAGDIDKLQALVDAMLNTNPERGEPRQNFKYRVASNEVVVEYLEYGRMRSTATENNARRDEDYTSQFELVVRLIVGKTEEDSATASDPVVFCPFLFVDNWASMISGREVLGLWKRMAAFSPGRGDKLAAQIRDRLWGYDRDQRESDSGLPPTVKRIVQPAIGGADCLSGRIDDSLVPRHDPGKKGFAIKIEHDLNAERQALRASRFAKRRIGGILPWDQTDLGRPEFRRRFARDWLRVSGDEFDNLQRAWLPRPYLVDNLQAPPYRGWIRTRYRIRNFRLSQPSKEARLYLGVFEDAELANLIRSRSGAAHPVIAEMLDPGNPATIDLARLLLPKGVLPKAALQNPEPFKLVIPPSDWYLARGDFDVKVIDRLA